MVKTIEAQVSISTIEEKTGRPITSYITRRAETDFIVNAARKIDNSKEMSKERYSRLLKRQMAADNKGLINGHTVSMVLVAGTLVLAVSVAALSVLMQLSAEVFITSLGPLIAACVFNGAAFGNMRNGWYALTKYRELERVTNNP